ncbi:MAG: radical SAM/SPASM domain-containing protein [Bacteriovoracia bacterium]
MKAIVRPRVFSAEKSLLQDVVPLDTPYSAHIDIASLCNFRCTFCFQSDKQALKEKGVKQGFMDINLFKKIVDDLKLFPRKLKKVKIGNHGEPTLHKKLPEMVAYLRDADVAETIELFTNGALLKPSLNLALVEAGLQRMNISVEGMTSEVYQKTAGVSINMDEFVNNIRHLYENKKQLVLYVKIVDTYMNEQDREEFYKRYGDIADEVFIERVVPQWPEHSKFEVDDMGMYRQKSKKKKDVCPFPFMYLHFNSDGSVAGCTLDWSREVLIGDANKETAFDIWNGERLKQLQVKMLQKQRDQIPICKDCSAPSVCCVEDLDDDAEKILEKILAKPTTNNNVNSSINEEKPLNPAPTA